MESDGMNKWQALDHFWQSFGLTAYDETIVPDDAQMPYITYSAAVDRLDGAIPLTANLWYKSTSWEDVSQKADEILAGITAHGYYLQKLDEGYMMIVPNSTFAQRMSDPDDTVRRIYLSIVVEFLAN